MDYLSTICNHLPKRQASAKGQHTHTHTNGAAVARAWTTNETNVWHFNVCHHGCSVCCCPTALRCVRACVCAGVDAWQWCNVKHGTDILRFTGITASTFFSTSISLNARDATDRASVCTDFSFNVCSPPLRTVFRIRHFLFFLLSYKRFFFFVALFRSSRRSLARVRNYQHCWCCLFWYLYWIGMHVCSYLDFIFFRIFFSFLFWRMWLNKVNTSWTNGPSGGVVWNET